MKIRKRMDTEECRKFWGTPPLNRLDDVKELPRLGDAWWKAEDELSIKLLNIKLPGDARGRKGVRV